MKRLALLTLIALSIGTTAVSAGGTDNRWSTISGSDFSRCTATTNCFSGVPCNEETFQLDDGCYAECFPAAPGCVATSQVFLNDPQVFFSGFAGHYPCGAGDTLPGTNASIVAVQISESLFQISGTVNVGGINPKIVEISLFRFAGDPTSFNGLDLTSVSDLVTLGLISNDDVLFVMQTTGGDFDEQIDVTGIPEDELVVMAAGNGAFPSEHGCPVPALGTLGATALVGLLLVLGTEVRRRRLAR